MVVTVRLPSGARNWLAHTVRFRSCRLIPRSVHAAWHHSAAFLREFRIPIVGFLVLTLVGALIDRPYVIVQLMVLEAPETVPPEAALAAFWYFMPVGDGLVLFARQDRVMEVFFRNMAETRK